MALTSQRTKSRIFLPLLSSDLLFHYYKEKGRTQSAAVPSNLQRLIFELAECVEETVEKNSMHDDGNHWKRGESHHKQQSRVSGIKQHTDQKSPLAAFLSEDTD